MQNCCRRVHSSPHMCKRHMGLLEGVVVIPCNWCWFWNDGTSHWSIWAHKWHKVARTNALSLRGVRRIAIGLKYPGMTHDMQSRCMHWKSERMVGASDFNFTLLAKQRGLTIFGYACMYACEYKLLLTIINWKSFSHKGVMRHSCAALDIGVWLCIVFPPDWAIECLGPLHTQISTRAFQTDNQPYQSLYQLQCEKKYIRKFDNEDTQLFHITVWFPHPTSWRY